MPNHENTFAPGATAPPDVPAPHILRGAWVTSHAGHLQVIGVVKDPWAPPQSGGYDARYASDGTTLQSVSQREGYFHTAAVTCYEFDGAGTLRGHIEHVRGGFGQHQSVDFTGTYEAWLSTLWAGSPLYWGRISTSGPIGVWNYYFAMPNDDTLEWVWIPPVLDPAPSDRNHQPRPLVARGTSTRVRYAHR